MRLGVFATTCILGLSLSLCASASTVIIQFNELPQQDANGVSIDGVTFGFPAGGSVYGYNLGIPTQYLTDPVLDGDTGGALTLSFANATPVLSFDIVLATTSSITDGYQVNLSNNGSPVYSQQFNLAPPNGFLLAEGVFSYSGAPINFASISFPNTTDNNSDPVSSFAIDNLTFNNGSTPSDPQVTPEPGTMLLLPVGLVALGFAKRFSRNRS